MDLSLPHQRRAALAATARPRHALFMLRLALGWIVLLGSMLCFLGTSWDIQWHSLIGRDRTLIPPHLMMLSGVTLGGLAAVTAVLLETLRARRDGGAMGATAEFAGVFQGPIGAFVAGFGALDAAVAFPLDAYWHSLYGIDVAIWAPFHVMILGGMAVGALGGSYMLASGARLAADAGADLQARASSVGAVVALAATLNIFMFLVIPARGSAGSVEVGAITIGAYPLLAGLATAAVLLAAVLMVPWRWAATSVAIASLVLVVAVAAFVPPATDLLVGLEQQAFRGGPGTPSLVALQWPLTPLIAAILVDLGARMARRRSWPPAGFIALCGLACAVACLPFSPLVLLRATAGGGDPSTAIWLLLGANQPGAAGLVGSLFSLLIGTAGGIWGAWFGLRMGSAPAGAEAGA